MDIVINILVWLHLAALVVGMGSGFASGQVAMRIGGAPAEARETMWGLYAALARFAQAGLGTMIVTGLLILFLRYGNPMGLGVWFWIKMALVVVLIVLISVNKRTVDKVRGGDAGMAPRAQRLGMLSGLTGFAVIFAAVFAFG